MIAEHRIDAFSFVRLFLNVSTIRGFGLFIVHEFGFGLLTCPLLGGYFRRYFATLWTKPHIVDDTLLSSKVGCIP